MSGIPAPKRGATPSPRHELAAATPHVATVAAPPNFIMVPQQISMWGNDVHGDCVTAEEAFAKACNNPEIFISDNEVITWATNHGVLEGAFLTQVMQWMQNDGFSQNESVYDDGPYFSVDWTTSATLQSAISEGPVKIGVAANQLETAWRSTGGRTGWFGIGFQSDSAEDHCVSLCGYGTLAWLAQQLHVQVPAGVNGTSQGYALFTWNTIGIIDHPSMVEITHEAWLRRPTTVVPAQPSKAPAGAVVAASNQFGLGQQTDVFLVDVNGSLNVAWVVGAGAWNGPFPIGPRGLFPPGAAVSASNQFGLSHQTDVFAVGTNGALYVAWVVDAGAWNGPAPIGPSGLFPPGGAVSASNQFGLNQQTDVFAIDTHGTLQVAWVVGAGAWNGPAPIGPPGLFPPGAAVFASNQFGLSHQTDVFAVGTNGALYVAWVVDAGAWNGPVPISRSGLFPPGAAVSASNQFGLNQQTDVFAIDTHGTLQVAWVVGAGAWNGPAPIGPSGLFPPGAAVSASNQFGLNQQTDVFAVGRNGVLQVAWVVGAGAWNGPAPIGPSGLFPPGAAVVASNQFGLAHQTNVFAVGISEALHVAWVVDAGNWNGPVPI